MPNSAFIGQKFTKIFFYIIFFIFPSFCFAQDTPFPTQDSKSQYSESKDNVTLKVSLESFSEGSFSLLLQAKPNSSRIDNIRVTCGSGKHYKPIKTLRGTQIQKEVDATPSENFKRMAVTFVTVAMVTAPSKKKLVDKEKICPVTGEKSQEKEKSQSFEEKAAIASTLALLMNADVSREEIVLATFTPDKNDEGKCETDVDIRDKRGHDISFRFPLIVEKTPISTGCPCGGEGCNCHRPMQCGGAMEGTIYGGEGVAKTIKRCPIQNKCPCGGEKCMCVKHLDCGGAKEITEKMSTDLSDQDDQNRLDELRRQWEDAEKKAHLAEQEFKKASEESREAEAKSQLANEKANKLARQAQEAQQRAARFEQEVKALLEQVDALELDILNLKDKARNFRTEKTKSSAYESMGRLAQDKDSTERERSDKEAYDKASNHWDEELQNSQKALEQLKQQLKEAQENARREREEADQLSKEATQAGEDAGRASVEADEARIKVVQLDQKAREARKAANEAKQRYEQAQKELEAKRKKKKEIPPKTKKICPPYYFPDSKIKNNLYSRN